MTGPSIEISGLTKRFGSFVALDGLQLKLEGAKCVGFLGPNGAGKTTALKLLTDMIFPTAGECFINGISVQQRRKVALADAGTLIESPEIYPSLTPVQALEMVADLRGVPVRERDSRIHEVLAEVKMSDWADKRFGKFSKGMKQRINIAAALVHDPEVVILDEPATGLDPRGMAEVREIVRGLKKRNRLIFMSSHILQEVTDVCDEVALIDHGKLLFYDTLSNVTSRFGGGHAPLDVGFAAPADMDAVTKKIGTLPGIESCTVLDPRRVRVKFSGDLAAREELLRSLAGLRIGIISLSEAEGLLEEIYLKEISRGDS
ncbi:MAG: ABC transporter ATP-binding protein [Thermoplasmata archaeon]